MTSVNQETEGVNQLAAAFTPCLPQVHKDGLLSLVKEAIKPETAQTEAITLEESLSLLSTRFSGNIDRLVAFLLQSLSALGWDEGELVDELDAVADKSFSLESSFPEVWRMAGETKLSIKGTISSIGTEIDSTLLDFYVHLLRLTLSTLLPRTESTEPETFYEMFDRLLSKTESPSKTASIIRSVLHHFRCKDVNINKLDSYVIPGFNLRQSYLMIFVRLRIAEFLCIIGEKYCILAMMAFSRLYLSDEAIHRYSPLQFINVIFERNAYDEENLNRLAECFSLPNFFNTNQPQASLEATPTNDDQALTQETEIEFVMKVRMKFMIEPYHPENEDADRLERFITDYYSNPEATATPLALPTMAEVFATASGHTKTDVRSSINNDHIEDEPTHCCAQTTICDYVKKHKKLSVTLLAVLILLVICIAVAVGLYIPHWINKSNNLSTLKNTTLLGTNDNPVLLDISSNSNCLEIYGPVNVYRVQSDNLTTSYNELSPVPYSPPSPNTPECVPQNYHHSQDPINLAPQSQLLYNVTIQDHLPTSEYNSSVVRKDDCVRIYFVNSREAYDQLTPHSQPKLGYCDTEGIHIVYQSECMDLRPNETKSVWLADFNVTEQADYYVVLETSGRYAYDTIITGTQVTYEVYNSKRICTPSLSNRTCVITSCDYSLPYYEACPDAFSSNEGGGDSFSYLIQSSDNNDVSVNISSIKELSGINCAFAVTFSAASFLGAVLLFVCILCCCCWCQNENSNDHDNNYGTF